MWTAARCKHGRANGGCDSFFLDPQGFRLDGQFASYPLESAQTGDVLCRKEASAGLTELVRLLGD